MVAVADSTYVNQTGDAMTGRWFCPAIPPPISRRRPVYRRDHQIAAVSAAGVLVMEYTARTGTTAVNPGSGRIAWNSVNQFDATQLHINSVSAINRDWTSFWAALQIGQKITIQLKASSALSMATLSLPASRSITAGGLLSV